jgi:hypothetical protein
MIDGGIEQRQLSSMLDKRISKRKQSILFETYNRDVGVPFPRNGNPFSNPFLSMFLT